MPKRVEQQSLFPDDYPHKTIRFRSLVVQKRVIAMLEQDRPRGAGGTAESSEVQSLAFDSVLCPNQFHSAA